MEKGNTKERILAISLNLFSVNGFEATSISQIADTVGIRKASLYSHYKSKQGILDTLIDELSKEYEKHSIFARADWNATKFTKKKQDQVVEEIISEIKGQVRYIIHAPKISKIRKLLTIEQYQNKKIKRLQSKYSYENILEYNIGLIRFMIKKGILRDNDSEIMAAQLAWPISMWIYLCDREPKREAEVMELLDRHVRQFFNVYNK